MLDVGAWFKLLAENNVIKLTIFYDSYDRARFLTGFATTLELSAYCLVLSMALGAIVAWLAGSRNSLIRWPANGFVQLYFFYFAISPLLPKVGGMPILGSMGWAVVSLTLLEAAFVAEIFRAGIEAVPKPMVEAAQSLGYSRTQIF